MRRMASRLGHRGPDGEGFWQDPGGLAALGHTRLKVLDPLPRSDQPMRGSSGRILVYNGEMYVFQALRRELEGKGRRFTTSGDTEVVLAALEAWGRDALFRFSGMFALGSWDPGRRHLLLARDRLGIKPLFWAQVGSGLVFASEIPALLAHPGVRRDLSREGLAAWLQLGYGAGEETLVPGVRRLPPGHVLEWRDGKVTVSAWYDLLEAVGAASPDRGADDVVDELDEILGRAVSDRLVSDVPLGCFLSGGVDSAVVAAEAAAHGANPETLTVQFPGAFDETPEAARTASALDLDHHVEPCAAADMLALIDTWAEVGNDPIADPSLAPTWVVSQAARRRWTVALSGDGGDELLSGYPRLRFMPRLEKLWGRPGLWRLASWAPLPRRRWATKLRAAAAARDPWTAYQCLQGVWPRSEVEKLLGGGEIALPWPRPLLERLGPAPPWRRYRLLDLLTFLPERVLAKVDRASMSHGLEVRVPLLDRRIVELVLSLPEERATGKGLLRAILARHVPEVRPPHRKRGFEVPLGEWMRGPLRDAIRRDLFGGTTTELGLDPGVLEAAWRDHQAGRADLGERLLAVAVLGRWCRRWLG